MRLLERVANNVRDTMVFGPQFLLRHLPRVTGTHTVNISIPPYGNIHMRAGESDVAVVRQVFGELQYDISSLPKLATRVHNRYCEVKDSGSVPVIVDAGANIGAASLWFHSKYPDAKIIAVEPDPSNLSVLKLNTKENDHFTVIEAAIGSRPGHVSLSKHGLGWATQTHRSESGIPVVTMQEAFGRAAGTPFIAKIDIEGFERDLFSANTEWLEQVYVVYIEPHDWMLPGKFTSRTFQRAMAQYDFEVFLMGENLVYVRL